MPSKLKPKQRRAARMLARGSHAADIAVVLRLRSATLSRWKQLPAFMEEIERIARADREVIQYKLAHLAEASVNALWSELGNSDKGSKRFQTALYVLKEAPNGSLTVPNGPQTAPGGPQTGPIPE